MPDLAVADRIGQAHAICSVCDEVHGKDGWPRTVVAVSLQDTIKSTVNGGPIKAMRRTVNWLVMVSSQWQYTCCTCTPHLCAPFVFMVPGLGSWRVACAGDMAPSSLW